MPWAAAIGCEWSLQARLEVFPARNRISFESGVLSITSKDYADEMLT